jgi:hypothetical protein
MALCTAGVLAMSLHAYPPAAALADLARAGIGAGAVAVPLLVVGTETPIGPVLLVMLAVFAAFGVRAALLLLTRYRVDEGGIGTIGPVARSLSWADVRRIKLAYYSTRRDRSGGWMQLTLIGRRCRLSLDSRVDGFAGVARLAADAAAANGAVLDGATLGNFRALGIVLEDGSGRPPERAR